MKQYETDTADNSGQPAYRHTIADPARRRQGPVKASTDVIGKLRRNTGGYRTAAG